MPSRCSLLPRPCECRRGLGAGGTRETRTCTRSTRRQTPRSSTIDGESAIAHDSTSHMGPLMSPGSTIRTHWLRSPARRRPFRVPGGGLQPGSLLYIPGSFRRRGLGRTEPDSYAIGGRWGKAMPPYRALILRGEWVEESRALVEPSPPRRQPAVCTAPILADDSAPRNRYLCRLVGRRASRRETHGEEFRAGARTIQDTS
jgi:hypothetical protein